MLVPCSYLLRASNTTYLNTKGILHIWTQKFVKIDKKCPNTRKSAPIYVYEISYENISVLKTYEHVSEIGIIQLIWFLSFPCKCNQIVT